ncbi:MAG: flagellar basal body rod protein FlgB [Planctomycetes bacterium]|nr:flagellar basal body rod protein FlgB [Planctomycetota bacterium]
MLPPTLFNKGSIPILDRGISFAARRHQVLVHNIANSDTPFYKVRDLPVDEFHKLLRRSIEERDRRPVPVFRFEGSSRILPTSLGGVAARPLEPGRQGILKHDENTFRVETEMAKLAQNTGMYNTLTQILGHQYDLIQSAIRERVA